MSLAFNIRNESPAKLAYKIQKRLNAQTPTPAVVISVEKMTSKYVKSLSTSLLERHLNIRFGFENPESETVSMIYVEKNKNPSII